MKKIGEKIKELNKQCSLCAAKFEIWLSNLNLNEDRKEKIQEHFFGHCPPCARADER